MQFNLSDLNVSNWSVDDVISFLHSIGITQYDSSFKSNHINGHALLLLTPQELKHDLGIASLGHRKQMIECIDRLQNKGSGNEYANEYAMTATISAALSSILTQHYKQKVHPIDLLKQTESDCGDDDDHINDINNRNSIVRVAVCMATEAARYIIHNQERIINVINTHPINHGNNNILDTLTNCRKLFAFNGNEIINNTNEAKRSNRAWTDCDERELIKLKSLGTLTWNRIGECLQRTGAACQLHWKTMKKIDILSKHIEYIKKNNNNRALISQNQDIDHNLLRQIDTVLKTNQWKINMLDVLLQNVEKEIEQKKDIIIIQNHIIDNNHSFVYKDKEKHKKKKKKKKHRKKKHKNNIKTEPINDEIINGTIKSLIEERKRRSSRSNARWTAEEEEILIKMLSQNKSLPDIAAKLGRSIPAINQHRLAMKHKNAKSLNDSSDDQYDSNQSATEDSDQDEDDQDEDEDEDDDEEDDDDIHRNDIRRHVVLTPIITPNSYVSNTTMIRMPPQFNMSSQYNNNSNNNGVYGDTANSTTTTSSANSTINNNNNDNDNSTNTNPFKCMPMFNVNKKRSLSPPYLNNAHIAPPNKKARLSASDHVLPLIPNGTANNNTTSSCPESIVLPSLNTSFQST